MGKRQYDIQRWWIGIYYFPSGKIYVGDFFFPENDANTRASYDGEWKEDNYSGNGIMIWKTGQKYVGEFLNSKRQGLGVETYPENEPNGAVSYDGEWKEDLRSGTGTQTWKSGDKYVGEWKDGSRTGKGTYYWSDGQKYVGEFLNSKRHGLGIATYPENDTNNRVSYDGEWKEDKKSGNGTQLWNSGDKYVGEYQDGLQNGKGTYYYWPSGDKYVGEWQNGDRTGKGTYYWSDGQKYVGDFLNNKQHGQGVITYPEHDPNGAVSYNGEWKEDKKSGTGTFLWKSGNRYVGEWKDDYRSGKGTFFWANGQTYVGDFVNGNFHGNGIKYSATNSIIQEGKWERDEFIGK
jgi:hypothetical protein